VAALEPETVNMDSLGAETVKRKGLGDKKLRSFTALKNWLERAVLSFRNAA
jgi:hypothetical protein